MKFTSFQQQTGALRPSPSPCPSPGRARAAPARSRAESREAGPELTGRSLNKCVSWGRPALFWPSTSPLARTHAFRPEQQGRVGSEQTLRPHAATELAEGTAVRPHGPVMAMPAGPRALTRSPRHCDSALEAPERGTSVCPGRMDPQGRDSCSTRPFSWMCTRAQLTGRPHLGPGT